MKVFRIAMLALALCAAAASVASAQRQPEEGVQGGRRGGGMGGMILQGITLTEAQKVQQKAIREKYAPQMMKLRKDAETSGTPIDRAKLGDIRTAQSAELRAILTAEQQVTFDRNAAEMKARMAGRSEK